MPTIDLNCDLGEGAGHDAELMPLITSANIACGAHAGDEATMRATVELARRHRVAIGAHPGYADRANFGREEMELSAEALHSLVTDQLQGLARITRFTHVKPHGALYNQAARDPQVAEAVVAAVRKFDASLLLFGLAGSELVRAGRAGGLRVVEEVFADRTYQRDGSLTRRSRPDALITDEAAAVRQAIAMVECRAVRSTDGTLVPIVPDTLCLHGDGPHPVEFARSVRREFEQRGIRVSACR